MKRLKYTILVAALLFCYCLIGQTVKVAPYNPEYINYLENIPKRKSNNGNLGYVPMQLKINFINHDFTNPGKKKLNIPAKYDLRQENLLTPVKDQGGGNNGGNCWTFTALGAIESRWLKLGFSEYDLSEQHLAACHGYEWGYGEGGNELIALAYLTRLHGPILESINPYNTDNDFTYCIGDTTVAAYVTEAVWLPDNPTVIKQKLMEYGGMSISMTWDGSAYTESNNTYYYRNFDAVNHAIMLVGWDDNLQTSAGAGAWICRNQWNTDWGDEGYFYISYDDTKALSSVAYFPKRLEIDEIDHIYFHDTLGPNASIGIGSNTSYGLVKFEVADTQFVNRVGTFLNTDNSVVDIEIYDDFDGKATINMIGKIENQKVEYPGYYTFDVAAQVYGDFYVKVKYSTPGYKFPIPVEQKDDFDGAPFARPHIQSEKCWISRTGGGWLEIGFDKSVEADLCIRAYTRNDSPVAFFTADKKFVCEDGGSAIYTSDCFGVIDSLYWNFGAGAIPADTTISNSEFQPVTVAYSSYGTKDVKLIAYGEGTSDTLTRLEIIEVTDTIDVSIALDSIETVTGETFEMKASGADGYTWTGNLDFIKSDSSVAIAKKERDQEGYFRVIVTGTQGNCEDSDTIIAVLWNNPVNDHVKDAIMLSRDSANGPYHNLHATVQDGEPAPPEDGCMAPMSWCVEGGLQNSVWFKFVGPDTERASLFLYSDSTKSVYFDGQIAVYESPSPNDLLTGNFNLLAANDDIGFITKESRINVIRNLEKDSIYYVQVDGSAAGVEGYFYIELSKWAVDIEEYNDDVLLDVYPNPTSGMLNIEYFGNVQQDIELRIIDLSGKLVYQYRKKNAADVKHEIDLSGNPAGMYFFQLIGEREVATRKILLQ